MKLSTKSRYGTRLLIDICIHQHRGPVSIQESAERQKLSVNYLERIAHELKKAGVIVSKRGKKGGYLLAREARDISVGQIVRLLEEEPDLVSCVTEDPTCPNAGLCPTRRVWTEASQAMYAHLDSVTLEELARCVQNGSPSGSPPVSHNALLVCSSASQTLETCSLGLGGDTPGKL